MIGDFLSGLVARLQGWAVTILAVLAAIGTAFVVGRSKGKQTAHQAAEAEKAKSDAAALNEALNAAKERNDADIETSRLPAGGATDRLRNDWSRD